MPCDYHNSIILGTIVLSYLMKRQMIGKRTCISCLMHVIAIIIVAHWSRCDDRLVAYSVIQSICVQLHSLCVSYSDGIFSETNLQFLSIGHQVMTRGRLLLHWIIQVITLGHQLSCGGLQLLTGGLHIMSGLDLLIGGLQLFIGGHRMITSGLGLSTGGRHIIPSGLQLLYGGLKIITGK